jgi:hypothetical protein
MVIERKRADIFEEPHLQLSFHVTLRSIQQLPMGVYVAGYDGSVLGNGSTKPTS